MLKLLRNRSVQKRIFIVLAVAVVISFAVSGILIQESGKNTPDALARLGNKKISFREYHSHYMSLYNQARQRYGDQFHPIRKFLNLQGQAWDRLLLAHHARREHIGIPDSEVVAWIAGQPAFQIKGQLDAGVYKRVLQAMRMDARDFEEDVRQQLAIQKIMERLRQKSKPGDEELRRAFQMEFGERDVVYAKLSSDSQKDAVAVTDEEVKARYEESKSAESGKEKPFEEASPAIREELLKNKAERAAREKLEALKKKIEKPEDFETVLKEGGLEVKTVEKFKKGVELGEGLPTAYLENALAKLETGKVSDVLTLPDGAILLKPVKDGPFDEKKFAEEKDKLTESLTDQKADEELGKLLQILRKDLSIDTEAMNAVFAEE